MPVFDKKYSVSIQTRKTQIENLMKYWFYQILKGVCTILFKFRYGFEA